MSKRKHSFSTPRPPKRISVEDLVPIVECPICTEIPRDGVMLTCINGHNVCAACKEKLGLFARCPTGRCDFNTPPAKNFSVSNLIEKLALEWPCKHVQTGCDFKGTVKTLADHEASCGRREVRCPYGCHRHIPVDDIFSHARHMHGPTARKAYLYDGQVSEWLLWKRHSMRTLPDFVWRRRAYCQMTGMRALLSAELLGDQLFVWVWTMLDEKSAAEYQCEITLNHEAFPLKAGVCPLYPIDWENRKVLQDARCMRINAWFLDKMVIGEELEDEHIQDRYVRFKIDFKVSKKVKSEIVHVQD